MRSHISTQLWVLHCSQPFIMPPNAKAVAARFTVRTIFQNACVAIDVMRPANPETPAEQPTVAPDPHRWHCSSLYCGLDEHLRPVFR